MPSFEHEALLQLFRNEPALAGQLLRAAHGVNLPNDDAQTVEGNLNQLAPTEYRADLVIALGSSSCIVVEVQLGRDEGKRWSWPLYVAALRAKRRCPVHLLIVTTRPEIADWASKPIEMGHQGFCLLPWVVGPAAVPRIRAFEVARAAPELAVLSVLAHGHEDDAAEVALAALMAAAPLDDQRAASYHELVMRALGQAARAALEALMSSRAYEFEFTTELGRKYFQLGRTAGEEKGREEGLREGLEKGLEKGLAQGITAASHALLTILRRRGLALSAQQRERIESCTDAATLQRWIDHSFDVATADELLG